MDQSIATERISAGDEVVAAGGEQVGTVAAIHDSYLLVEKGVLFLTDYHVPFSAIDRYDADAGVVHLNVTTDQARSSGWDQHAQDSENAPRDTLLTGAASVPDPPDVAVTEEPDDRRAPETG